MYSAYRAVNHCLHAVQKLEAPLTEKLLIEIELLQIKRLLLLTGDKNDNFIKEVVDFEALQAAFTAASSERWSAVRLMALAKDLHASLRSVDSFTHSPEQQ